ncbi:MAG: ATP-binding protein, partial [Pseudomonadales bacterium]|nr:ATP-binding protein [Pseudomonadales bacterium]
MANTVWAKCIDHLQNELPAQQFNTWIRPLQTDICNKTLKLLAPNRFVMDWVSQRYLKRINELVGELQSPDVIQVELSIGTRKTGREETRQQEDQPSGGKRAEQKTGSFGLASRKRSEHEQSQAKSIKHHSGLNRSFTFDTFVEGKSNQLARAAAMQVAENPGGAYNPLFIYGGVGLGKTHLMHAVGNYMVRQKPDAKVVYLHSERFVADMVKALQMNAINEFKRFYRTVDALLIDDIQFFAAKERSQEEFFHTFNALLESEQQMILTCDR